MPTAKEDAQFLIDEFMPFAKRMLGEYGEFLPYGGHLTVSREIVHEGANTGEEYSESQALIEILREAHRQQARDGLILAACIVYDISIVVFPYTIDDSGEVTTEPPFAVRGESRIFPC